MKRKLCMLYIASFVSTVAPLTIYIVINKDKYISTVVDSVKLSAGFVICAILMLLKIMDKLKIPSGTTTYAIVFLLSYLLDAILKDLIILSFLALVGEMIDILFFRIPIKRLKDRIHTDKIARATSSQVKEVLEQYFRGGNNE
ncbi:MAG: hypothetical protein IJW19_00010 [Clostridia bacterium]|nr:hypothetical protein [Clostridia bacterium]